MAGAPSSCRRPSAPPPSAAPAGQSRADRPSATCCRSHGPPLSAGSTHRCDGWEGGVSGCGLHPMTTPIGNHRYCQVLLGILKFCRSEPHRVCRSSGWAAATHSTWLQVGRHGAGAVGGQFPAAAQPWCCIHLCMCLPPGTATPAAEALPEPYSPQVPLACSCSCPRLPVCQPACLPFGRLCARGPLAWLADGVLFDLQLAGRLCLSVWCAVGRGARKVGCVLCVRRPPSPTVPSTLTHPPRGLLWPPHACAVCRGRGG